MARLVICGATGALGGEVLRQALDARHQVSALVRTPAKLPAAAAQRIAVHTVDLGTIAPAELAKMIEGHDALIHCAGHVSDGQRFVELVDRVVGAVERLSPPRPVCWFLAGAALLDIDTRGRRGIDLPKVGATYWPHGVNFDRLVRSRLDWRLLCPGPMVDEPAIGLKWLRTSLDALPVGGGRFTHMLPTPLLLPLFASLVPPMIVSYADAAALMLEHIDPGNPMARRRVGLALPAGMRGRKRLWRAKPESVRHAA